MDERTILCVSKEECTFKSKTKLIYIESEGQKALYKTQFRQICATETTTLNTLDSYYLYKMKAVLIV